VQKVGDRLTSDGELAASVRTIRDALL